MDGQIKVLGRNDRFDKPVMRRGRRTEEGTITYCHETENDGCFRVDGGRRAVVPRARSFCRRCGQYDDGNTMCRWPRRLLFIDVGAAASVDPRRRRQLPRPKVLKMVVSKHQRQVCDGQIERGCESGKVLRNRGADDGRKRWKKARREPIEGCRSLRNNPKQGGGGISRLSTA